MFVRFRIEHKEKWPVLCPDPAWIPHICYGWAWLCGPTWTPDFCCVGGGERKPGWNVFDIEPVEPYLAHIDAFLDALDRVEVPDEEWP